MINRNTPTLIFDTSALISATLFEVDSRPILDHILDNCNIHIPNKVKIEAVDEGLKGGYPDAVILDQRIRASKISVITPTIAKLKLEMVLNDYGLEEGDKDLVRMCIERKNYQFAIVDDRLLYIVLNRFDLRPKFLPDAIEWLVTTGKWDSILGESACNRIRPRYRIGFITHSIEKIYGRL